MNSTVWLLHLISGCQIQRSHLKNHILYNNWDIWTQKALTVAAYIINTVGCCGMHSALLLKSSSLVTHTNFGNWSARAKLQYYFTVINYYIDVEYLRCNVRAVSVFTVLPAKPNFGRLSARPEIQHSITAINFNIDVWYLGCSVRAVSEMTCCRLHPNFGSLNARVEI